MLISLDIIGMVLYHTSAGTVLPVVHVPCYTVRVLYLISEGAGSTVLIHYGTGTITLYHS